MRVSALILTELVLCFGLIAVWWTWGLCGVIGSLWNGHLPPADVVTNVALGGIGLLGLARLGAAATHGTRNTATWLAIVATSSCGLAALVRESGLLYAMLYTNRRMDFADLVFYGPPALAALHMLLLAALRSRRSCTVRPSG